MTDGELAVVAVRGTEFEAATLVAILQEEGVPAAVSNNAPSWTGQMSISPTSRGASVLVRESDLERAQQILARREADSVDLDWDEVDVGERDDDLPLHPVGRMPLLARIAFAVAVALLALAALGTILLLIP